MEIWFRIRLIVGGVFESTKNIFKLKENILTFHNSPKALLMNRDLIQKPKHKLCAFAKALIKKYTKFKIILKLFTRNKISRHTITLNLSSIFIKTLLYLSN